MIKQIQIEDELIKHLEEHDFFVLKDERLAIGIIGIKLNHNNKICFFRMIYSDPTEQEKKEFKKLENKYDAMVFFVRKIPRHGIRIFDRKGKITFF